MNDKLRKTLSLDFSDFEVVDYLWPEFVERLGFEKIKQAVGQSLDLQRIYGNTQTIPALITETCGIALVNIDILYLQTGILCNRKGIILVLSIRKNTLQIICEL